MEEQKELDIDAAIVEFKTCALDTWEDGIALADSALRFARAVAAFVMDLDALELPEVAALMAEHGVRI